MEIAQICPTTAQNWIRKGALFVDVREKSEVETLSFDIENLINIPLSEFERRYQEIPKNSFVVLVCQTGARSLRATNFLLNSGYNAEQVVNMKYGLIRWVQKGFKTQGDAMLYLAGISECCSKGSCC